MAGRKSPPFEYVFALPSIQRTTSHTANKPYNTPPVRLSQQMKMVSLGPNGPGQKRFTKAVGHIDTPLGFMSTASPLKMYVYSPYGNLAHNTACKIRGGEEEGPPLMGVMVSKRKYLAGRDGKSCWGRVGNAADRRREGGPSRMVGG